MIAAEGIDRRFLLAGRVVLTSWVPKNENHAIDVMAAFIRFSEPIPDLLFRKALRRLGDVAEHLGLKTTAPIQRLSVRVEGTGFSTDQIPTPGRSFTRLADVEVGEEAEPFKNLEQLQFEASRIIYRTWDYVSWSWQVGRIRNLFSPVLELVGENVLFEAVGLEYLDQFRLEGEWGHVDELLDVRSPLIAPHVFTAPSLFHSHTGAFTSADSSRPIVQVVRVDAVEGEDAKRWINIVTNEEHRFTAEEEANPDVFSVFDTAHTNLKLLLSKVIVAEQSKRIYLQS